jgi:hypothetical protein
VTLNNRKFIGKEKTGPLKKAAEKNYLKMFQFSDKLSTKVKEKLLVGGYNIRCLCIV